jgi:signal transduction histidine kinase/DNA-binding response OmpR family regulator
MFRLWDCLQSLPQNGTMDVRPGRPAGVSTRRRPSSLSRKYSLFTAFLLGWVAFIFFAYDLGRNSINLAKVALLCAVVVLVAGAIAKFTNHLMARPLMALQGAIRSVREGRLKPVPVSRTGDEIQFLAESFNEMIAALSASQQEVAEHRGLLEERIKQRTEALEEATHRALAASRTKSEFLANMSHELRTPLNGVLGMLDIVLDSRLSLEQQEQLETAKGCASTLLALLNDILDLSKIEAGRMALEKIPFDLRVVADECVKAQLPKARQKGVALRCLTAPDLAPQVIGDPLRMRQVLVNLLSNAVKFTDSGFVELRMSAVEAQPNGAFVLVAEVADSGPGIPPEKLETIFEEFTQADGSISRRYGGTGLGLAITRRLVEMHSGSISVESEVGRGSTFRVKLPCQAVRRAVESAPPGPVGVFVPAPELRRDTTAHILVAEDNMVNQKVVLTMLTRRGYEVHVASNGREALEALERNHYDLLLMDIQMPEMDGMEATRRIREDERWKDLPIIAITAHAMQGDRERCLQAGMNDFASKPVSPPRLVEMIEHHLRGRTVGRPSPKPAGELPPPIDSRVAERLMDKEIGLMRGMTLLFLHLAPERLAKLRAAAARLDSTALRAEARRIGKAAERIAALELARVAGAVETSAAADDFSAVQEALLDLEREMGRLDRHVRLRQEDDAREPTADTERLDEPVPLAS